jgi:hypothetical protein
MHTLFDRNITGQGNYVSGCWDGGLRSIGQVSETLGPARTACLEALDITIDSGGASAGELVLEGSHHQGFPGTPTTLETFTLGPAGTQTHSVTLDSFPPFVRVRVTVAVDGQGARVYARGR